jgi:nucleotide-binding universal stress UspA family protein
MKTLIVPTDFSSYSNNAIEYAVEIAKATSAGILLVHVVSSAEKEAGAFQFYDVRDKLEAISAAISTEYPQLQCTPHIASGNVVQAILTIAEEREGDMIVMGTKGMSKLENLLFGSNTASVIERATCPVLSVPKDTSFVTPGKIMFATNFSHEDINGALAVVSLAKAFGSSVIISHVTIENERLEADESLLKFFSHEVSKLTDYNRITYKLSADNTVSMGLDTLIVETHADMLALSTRRRSLVERIYNPSLTQKFSAHAAIPLLAFHNN